MSGGSRRLIAALVTLAVLVVVACGLLVWAVRSGDDSGVDGSRVAGAGADSAPSDGPSVGADGGYRPGKVGSEDRQAALAAAVAAVPPALSYDYAHLDASLTSATSTMTAAFADEFRETFDATVRPLAADKQAVTQARVRAAGVVDAAARSTDGASVSVLVFVDQVLVSSKAMRRSETPIKVGQTRVVVTLVPVGDAWKVDDISPL